MDKSKRIILPVEIQNREILAKIYLAAIAASRGFEAIVGDQKEIVKLAVHERPAVYIDKSSAKTKFKFFRRLRKLGHVPVVLCEEGLVYRNTDRYLKERVDQQTINSTKGFFCWGEQQKDDVCSAVQGSINFQVTGNPRFDLLRPEFRHIWIAESEKLKKEWGKYILINTNFSRFNKLPGTDDVIELLKKRGTLNEGSSYYEGLVQRLGQVLEAFQKAIPLLAQKFPDHKIIVRPHPGENEAIYKELEALHSNIKVCNSGSVIPWLVAAECIVHNSCTTGVEAWILNRPVVSYTPVEDSIYDSHLPTELSYKCYAESDLLNQIEYLIEKKLGAKKDPETLELASHYICGLTGPLAAEQLIDQLPDLTYQPQVFDVLTERVKEITHSTLRKIPGLRVSQALTMLARQKFLGFDEVAANEFIDKVKHCRPDLKGISIRKLHGSKNVFYIKKET